MIPPDSIIDQFVPKWLMDLWNVEIIEKSGFLIEGQFRKSSFYQKHIERQMKKKEYDSYWNWKPREY